MAEKDLKAVPGGMDVLSSASSGAGALITGACSAPGPAYVAAVAAALGPFGLPYTAAYAAAQFNNLTSGVQCGTSLTKIAEQTVKSKVGYQRVDGQ